LSSVNLDGDGQGDLSVHGGPDKAVYAYPSEHWEWWTSTAGGSAFGPASFGENLSTSGATESDVCIGDRWMWGDAVLEVCQPRTPCYKLALHRGTAEVGRQMRATGRSGWYLRVLTPGEVPTAVPVGVAVEAGASGISVADVTAAARSRDPDAIAAVLAVAALADEWRVPLRQMLAG
jgi:MOSC domain-containing protein YiiM